MFNTATDCVHSAKIELCFLIALLGSFAKPIHSLRIILFNTVTTYIHPAKTKLSIIIALICGFSEPIHRFFTLRIEVIKIAKNNLNNRIPLLGSLAHPEKRFLILLRITMQHQAKFPLPPRIALLGGFAIPGFGYFFALGNAVAHKAGIVHIPQITPQFHILTGLIGKAPLKSHLCEMPSAGLAFFNVLTSTVENRQRVVGFAVLLISQLLKDIEGGRNSWIISCIPISYSISSVKHHSRLPIERIIILSQRCHSSRHKAATLLSRCSQILRS